MENDVWPKKVSSYDIYGKQPRGRPCKRLCDVVAADMKTLNLCDDDALERAAWRRVIKPAMQKEKEKKKKIQHNIGVLPTYVDRWT